MKSDIVLAGVGGQGILTIATILGAAALQENLYLKQAEVHGMSQRGGDVQSNLRLSSRPIHSDLIPLGGADLIVSLEPMEALRYLPFLSKQGWIVTNSVPFVNIDNYPEMSAIEEELSRHGNVIRFDMEAMAKEVATAIRRTAEYRRNPRIGSLRQTEGPYRHDGCAGRSRRSCCLRSGETPCPTSPSGFCRSAAAH